jgi:hypothetical protein
MTKGIMKQYEIIGLLQDLNTLTPNNLNNLNQEDYDKLSDPIIKIRTEIDEFSKISFGVYSGGTSKEKWLSDNLK